MREAVFVSYARTGLAKAGRGGFNITPAMTMAAHAISSAVEKAGIEPELVEDVALGNGAHGAANLGRLAALLIQFPWSYANTPENVQYLTALFRMFAGYPMALEVRHGSWDAPEFFGLLREHNVGYCNIDQPVIGKSLQPSAVATSPVRPPRQTRRTAPTGPARWLAPTKRAHRVRALPQRAGSCRRGTPRRPPRPGRCPR